MSWIECQQCGRASVALHMCDSCYEYMCGKCAKYWNGARNIRETCVRCFMEALDDDTSI